MSSRIFTDLPVPLVRQRVLFLLPAMTGGGAERVVVNLLRHLDRSLFEPQLVMLQARGEFLRDIPSDIAVHDLKASRLRYALPALVRLIRRLRPGVVLSTIGYTNLVLPLIRPFLPRGTRVLIREPTVAHMFLPEETRHPWLWAWLYRCLYKRADGVVCQSDTAVSQMVEHFDLPREKLVRIYNPVDVERVCASADGGPNPFSGAGPHLVAAGQLRRVKGFDILLEAMPAVVERLPNARLVILGRGPLRDALSEQVRQLGLTDVVRFPGFRRNPWTYLRHADAFILPSRHECLANIMLEALTLETPVIAADCPGATREVQAQTEGMVLVPPDDPAALAGAIVAVCQRRRIDRAPAASSAGTLSRFDVRRIVPEYSRLFLGKEPPARVQRDAGRVRRGGAGLGNDRAAPEPQPAGGD